MISLGTIFSGERSLYWKLTGRENLEYFAALYNVEPSETESRIDLLLGKMDLGAKANELVERYSAGMRQRLAIARALLANPPYFMSKAFSVGGRAVGFQGSTGTSDYFSFVMVGAFMSSYIAVAFWGMAYSIEEDMILGVLEPNWVTPANRVSMLLGRSIMFALRAPWNQVITTD